MVMPNFSICGAPKAGTTSLYQYLSEHPDVLMSKVKETDFFQHNYDKGTDWFESLFDNWNGQRAIGEASPGNMAHVDAPGRMAKHIPDARLIFMLRNPVERAYSQYLYGFHRGGENTARTFGELVRDKTDPWGRRILELGMYAEQIARFDHFFARERMLFVLHEDFSRDANAEVRRVWRFLGIDDYDQRELGVRYNTTRYPRHLTLYRLMNAGWTSVERMLVSHGLASWVDNTRELRGVLKRALYTKVKNENVRLKKEDREYLKGYYYESVMRLSRMIDKDVSEWVL